MPLGKPKLGVTEHLDPLWRVQVGGGGTRGGRAGAGRAAQAWGWLGTTCERAPPGRGSRRAGRRSGRARGGRGGPRGARVALEVAVQAGAV